jgi:hypothetical protein
VLGREYTTYSIHEIFEGLDDEFQDDIAWTDDPCVPYGETKEEAIKDLEMMLEDAKAYPVYEVIDKKLFHVKEKSNG